jgi:hypothetical protein
MDTITSSATVVIKRIDRFIGMYDWWLKVNKKIAAREVKIKENPASLYKQG